MAVVETLGIGIAFTVAGGAMLTKATSYMGNFESGLKKANHAVTQLGFSLKRFGGGLAGSALAIGRLADDYIDLVAGISRGSFMIQKTTDLNSKSMAKFDQDIRKMSTSLATSQREIQVFAERAGAAGIGSELIESSKSLEMFDDKMKSLGISTNLSGKAMEAAQRELKEVTETLTKLGKVSNIDTEAESDRFLKAAIQFANAGETKAQAVKNFAEQLMVVASKAPGTEAELATLATKLINLKFITGASREELLALAGGISFVGEQSRTSANAITDVWLKLRESSDEVIMLFDSLSGFNSGEELEKALADPAKGFELTIGVMNEYSDALNRIGISSEEAKIKMSMIDAGTDGLLKSTVSNRIALNLSATKGFMDGLLQSIKGPGAQAFGFLDKMWKEYTKTSAFSIEQQKVAFENMKIDIGTQLLPIWLELSQIMLKFARDVMAFINTHPELKKWIREWGAKAIAIGFVAGKVIDLAGAFVLVLSGLTRLALSPYWLTLVGLPIALGLAFAATSSDFGDFRKQVDNFVKDIMPSFNQAVTSLQNLFKVLGQSIKDAFNSPEGKEFAKLLQNVSKGVIKFVFESVSAVSDYASGKDTNLGTRTVDNVTDLAKDVTGTDNIADATIKMYKWGEAIETFFYDCVSLLQTVGTAIYNTIAALGTWIGTKIEEGLGWALEQVILAAHAGFKLAFETIPNMLIETFGGAILAVVDLVTKAFNDIFVVPVNAFISSVGSGVTALTLSFNLIVDNFFPKLSSMIESGLRWVESIIEFFSSSEDNFDIKSVPKEADSDQPANPFLPMGQTGRLVKKRTEHKGLQIGEAGSEAIVPLDQDSRTRGMRTANNVGTQTINIAPAKVDLILDGKIVGRALIKFVQTEKETQYGDLVAPLQGIS